MRIYFYPLGAVTLLASILLITGVLSNSLGSIDGFGSRMIDGMNFLRFFSFIGTQGFLAAVSVLAVLFLWFRRNNYLGMILVLLAVGGGNMLNKGIKRWIERERPEAGLAEGSFSFPSGHAMVSLIAAIVIIFLITEQVTNRKSQLLMYAAGISLSILTGLSRLTAGAHFFTDVIGGWLIGYTYAILCLLLYEWFLKRRSQISPS
ncbi:phosphatase PAP2 family protein [Jeotgalibacillus proteolyticus]|uniref:Phosphatase PAP2 family protein n=1 Tax=Jeotgalibacillus proteolyticus TaxID=2082395 RepID=A0A2S5GHL5_9BACL|nr:phosphatase PAP2 family protein [Jeotgalibacillus proteolyticus]PPA72401.1 phosphatase PAP2 family protein [Jeotgalibacillus proteolyticus]